MLTRWPLELPAPERKPESWLLVILRGMVLAGLIGLLIIVVGGYQWLK